ncbi:MAG: NAD-dependent epimerase/dehydratase family protein [Bdellovibrionota bacterium]
MQDVATKFQNSEYKETIAVVGGAGYIGSQIAHDLRELHQKNVVIFDNFSTGHRRFVKDFEIFEGDIRNPSDIQTFFQRYTPDVLMHLAAKAACIRRSILWEYHTNVTASIDLFSQAIQNNCRSLYLAQLQLSTGLQTRLPLQKLASFVQSMCMAQPKKWSRSFCGH